MFTPPPSPLPPAQPLASPSGGPWTPISPIGGPGSSGPSSPNTSPATSRSSSSGGSSYLSPSSANPECHQTWLLQHPAPFAARAAAAPMIPLSLPDAKRAAGRRIKWASLLLVPVLLITLSLATRWLAHPAALDVLTGMPGASFSLRMHAHHEHVRRGSGSGSGEDPLSSAIAFPSPSSSAPPASGSGKPSSASSAGGVRPTDGALPPIPVSAPVLPTPFPQPLDTSLGGGGLRSQACANFLVNMTQTDSFRACRPFSALLQSSSAFLAAQTNASALTTLVWGTCHARLDADTCAANMAWFAGGLRGACGAELAAKSALVLGTLDALLAYSVMRQAACAPDRASGAYCFVAATAAEDPSDLYFFNLPLGTPLPNTTTPSCSACTKTLLALYADARPGAPSASANATLDALGGGVYERAAEIAVRQCGADYAVTDASANGAPARPWGTWAAAAALAAVLGALVLGA